MKVLSLFTGIGGVELGLERTGMFKPMAFVERDPFCQKVLARHWPEVTIFDDVEKMPAACPDPPDVITAGFPCQPVSHAGRRLAQKDERWMWPHVERCVRVLRPRGVLLENVPGLLTAGFDDVIGGLAACGYDAEWDCIPAAAVGAPHLRDRVFIIATPGAEHVAYAHGAAGGSAGSAGEPVHEPGTVQRSGRRGGVQSDTGWPSPMAYAKRGRQRQQREPGRPEHSASDHAGEIHRPIHDGIWPAEPNVGRVANGVPRRVDRLRALGNAVVPQVAEYVGYRLAEKIAAA